MTSDYETCRRYAELHERREKGRQSQGCGCLVLFVLAAVITVQVRGLS